MFAVLAIATRAIYTKEVLDFLGDLAVGAIDLLVGRQLKAGKRPLLRQAGMARRRAEELGHGVGVGESGYEYLRRSFGWPKRKVLWCEEVAVSNGHV